MKALCVFVLVCLAVAHSAPLQPQAPAAAIPPITPVSLVTPSSTLGDNCTPTVRASRCCTTAQPSCCSSPCASKVGDMVMGQLKVPGCDEARRRDTCCTTTVTSCCNPCEKRDIIQADLAPPTSSCSESVRTATCCSNTVSSCCSPCQKPTVQYVPVRVVQDRPCSDSLRASTCCTSTLRSCCNSCGTSFSELDSAVTEQHVTEDVPTPLPALVETDAALSRGQAIMSMAAAMEAEAEAEAQAEAEAEADAEAEELLDAGQPDPYSLSYVNSNGKRMVPVKVEGCSRSRRRSVCCENDEDHLTQCCRRKSQCQSNTVSIVPVQIVQVSDSSCTQQLRNQCCPATVTVASPCCKTC